MSKPTSKPYDLLIRNVRVVRPHGNVVHEADIAIKDGKFARVAPGIDPLLAKSVHEGRGLLAFPGVVDAHMHSGIYSPLGEDAVSESKAAAMGGVTSSLNYFRTGQYYLNKRPIKNETLANQIKGIFDARTQDKILYVKADRNLQYSKVLDAIDVAAHNGVRVVGAISDQTPGTESHVAGDVLTNTKKP